ncbi:hypothetical protein LOTGIDRAFT_166663 [Lottia gigantea]|uniref:TIR domain-containing protein n=1 Tax=Lottia gigantea TaxID=225164 RepID=V3ZWG7_LOTGI|nr:hypothetical protein LOTGIDRAFT_166663 [Lottia gigantea]ESO86935.1 hypothetical protein LOTGIDRAFT_166663 [Lottia gigantea]
MPPGLPPPVSAAPHMGVPPPAPHVNPAFFPPPHSSAPPPGAIENKWSPIPIIWKKIPRLLKSCVCRHCLWGDNFKQFTDKTALKNKTSKPFFIIKATVCLVKNLAKNVGGERANLGKCFLTHLNSIRTVEELTVFAIIGSVLICNRCEAKRETESRETVPYLFYWINQSFEIFNDPASWNAMYHLQDAIDAIWILANFGSASRFCDSNVLYSFHQIIKTASLSEQNQTVEIIWVLCFDSEFEEFIKSHKIVKTMRLKERNDKDLKLLRRLNAVLTILRERYFPRSISLESSEASSTSVARIVYHTNNMDAAQKLYDKLRTENVSAHLNDFGENDPKYFETAVSWMQNCYCLLICVSEFTEIDYDSRTIFYIAQKLHMDIIAVFVNRNIPLMGWVYQELRDKPRFDFIESPFYVQDLSKLLLEKSIRFSRNHGLRNTRSLGSLSGQSKVSMLSDRSDVSRTSFESVGEIGKQSSYDRTSCSGSLDQAPTTNKLPDSSSFENNCLSMPERFKEMKKKDVSQWLTGLQIGINVREFRDVNGPVLWELFTACQTSDPFDEKSYDDMMEQFNLRDDQKVKFTDALLKL